MKAENKLKWRVNKNIVSQKIEQTEQNVYKRSSAKKINKAVRAVIAVLLCFVFLFCIFNIKYLTPSKMKEHLSAIMANTGKGEGFPYRFSSNEVLEFFEFNNSDYALLTKNELIILNKTAKPVLNYTHNMANPIVRYSSDRILLFDQGSTKAVVLNQSGVVLSFTNDEKLICGDICSNGKIALAFYEGTNKQYVKVFASSGKKLMEWKKGSGYIADVALNQNGSMLSVGLIDTMDAVQTVSVINFAVNSAKQKGHFDLKESYLYELSYINSSEIAVMSNDKLSIINAKGVLKHQADLASLNTIQLFSDNNGHFIHVYSLYNNGIYQVDVYNSALKTVYQKECNGEIRFVNCKANTLAVLFDDNHAELNPLGSNITYSHQFENDYSFILNQGRTVYMCSSGIVEKAKAEKI